MKFAASLFFASFLVFGTAAGGPVELKIATVVPEGSAWMKEMRAAAADVKARSGGRVAVKLYGGGVMGNDRQVLRKIRIGQLHGGAFTANSLAEKYPDIALYGLPMIFASQAEVDYVRERMDATLAAGLEKAGFVSFGIAGGGFARILAGKPVTVTADMGGLKIWVPEGDRISTAAMLALRLAPVSLPVTDVLTGLQTGLIDVIAAPPAAAIALQWHTRVKYVTDVPLMYAIGLMAIDTMAFSRMEPSDQQVFREVMGAVYRKLDQASSREDAAAQKALLAGGIKPVVANSADVAAWRRACEAANADLGSQGAYTPALLATLQKHLADFRRNGGIVRQAPAAP
ncbi:MAG: C4-dicarboxylate ABC transporter [Gammaproteobacteria bacterium]|nr:C4-dicarboxylate ABC transporter [Gammaproteobacteria bacterium]